jgi:hypothetical protein
MGERDAAFKKSKRQGTDSSGIKSEGNERNAGGAEGVSIQNTTDRPYGAAGRGSHTIRLERVRDV